MATTYPNTGRDARERSRLASTPKQRLVAAGGPVTIAVRLGRGEGIEAERAQIRGLVHRIRTRLDRDSARIDRSLAAAAARHALREDGGCA